MSTTNQASTPAEHIAQRQSHWDNIAARRAGRNFFSAEYHHRLTEIYQWMVSPGQRVLEVGCGQATLLAALKPSRGVGVDISGVMLSVARQEHPGLEFFHGDILDYKSEETFDVIILSDLVNDLWDIQQVFMHLKQFCTSDTRILINFHSRVYQPWLSLASVLGLATPTLLQNWVTPQDVTNLLHLAGYEVFRHQREILLPISLPLVRDLFNKVLVKLWPFNELAWMNLLCARPQLPPGAKQPSVSVIIPARNEAGNIEAAFQRTPTMGSHTELIFVEGHSKDNTFEAIQQAIVRHPERDARVFQQTGKGKADAVRLGFDEARGDILMILDADLTVRPEDLPRFYEALVSGKGEFINGVRLVYPMQEQAMRFLNLLGNKTFSLLFSWLLGQPIKDTLCGTKVLWNRDYKKIVANRSYFGEFDPFGDFDLIFGAAKQNRRIVDMPIRYQERTYGQTNIDRWRHGMLLFRMVAVAAFRLKFV